MTNELYRGDLSDVAKVYTTNGYLKVVQDKRKSGSLKSLYVKKQVTKDGIQARTGTCPNDYSYVVATTDINVDMDYLAFLINSFPWRIMLGNGLKVIEGIYTPTSLGGLKKLPVIILSKEEQEACAFLNTFITAMYDDMGKDEKMADFIKKAYRYLIEVRNYIALEILLDGKLGNPDISVLSAWMKKKSIYDNTQDKKEAAILLVTSIFSSNNDLRNRMNKMRMYIDENEDAIFNKFPK